MSTGHRAIPADSASTEPSAAHLQPEQAAGAEASSEIQPTPKAADIPKSYHEQLAALAGAAWDQPSSTAEAAAEVAGVLSDASAKPGTSMLTQTSITAAGSAPHAQPQRLAPAVNLQPRAGKLFKSQFKSTASQTAAVNELISGAMVPSSPFSSSSLQQTAAAADSAQDDSSPAKSSAAGCDSPAAESVKAAAAPAGLAAESAQAAPAKAVQLSALRSLREQRQLDLMRRSLGGMLANRRSGMAERVRLPAHRHACLSLALESDLSH